MSGPITPHRDPRNNWHPDPDATHQAANKVIESASRPVVQAVAGQTAQGGWKDRLDQLDSKGDTAHSRVLLDGEVDVNPLMFAGGVGGKLASRLGLSVDVAIKAQSAHQISVTRDSNAADSTYTVRYTKSSQAGLGAELTAGSPVTLPIPGLGGQLKGGVLPQGFLRGDGNAGVANTVEMRFNSKEEAQRAAETLEKLAAADVVDDGVQAALLTSKTNPTSPLFALAQTAPMLYEGSSNNLANPLSEYGEVNPGLRRAAGVSDADMDFLAGHITAQEATVMGGQRSAAEGRLLGNGKLQLPGLGKLDIPGLDLRVGGSIVPGMVTNNTYTRRVEYPTDVSAGRIVDTFGGTTQLNAKWRDVQALGIDKKGAGVVNGQHRADDNYELALASTTVSFEQRIPPGTEVNLGYLAGHPPDFSGPALVDTSVMTPTAAEWAALGGTFNPFSGQAGQAPQGQQRVDMQRTHLQYSVSGATGLAMAAAMPAAGGFSGLVWQGSRQGGFIENSFDLVQRDGTNTTETLRLAAPGFVAAEGSLTEYAGVDDYASAPPSVPRPPSGGPDQPDCPPPRPQPPDGPTPKPTAPRTPPTHWQVQPYEGVNVRSSPTTQGDNKVAVVQSGSFLDGSGETRQDQDGHTWIKVTGRDQEDKMVEGWVRSDNLKAYDKRYGDNDASGRINPAQEAAGLDKIVVRQDDNLWALADRYGQDFEQMLASNPHLLDPSLVFAGDTVYLPAH